VGTCFCRRFIGVQRIGVADRFRKGAHRRRVNRLRIGGLEHSTD
jgi:hypothetical protein